jgi:hypothetical protein
MKPPAILISSLVIAACAMGYVIYDKSKKHQALAVKLLATENAATQESDRLKSELATAIATSQNERTRLERELETAKRDSEAQLAAQKQKAEDEMKLLQAELADTKLQSQTSKQQSDALAMLMERVNAADAQINVQLTRLFATTESSEQTLFLTPSVQAFVNVKRNYESLLRAIDAGSTALGECERFITSNASGLSPFSQQVQAVSTRVARGKTSLSTAKSRVEQSLRCARESRFAVLANTPSWQASDLSIESGEQLAIQAKGIWKWAVSQANPEVGPEGTDGNIRYRRIDGFNNAALLLRIRGSESVSLGYGHLVPDRPGRVEFMINDTDTSDNRGTVDATIWVILPISQN